MTFETSGRNKRKKAREHDIRMRQRTGQYIRRLNEIVEKVEDVEPEKIPALRLKADVLCRLLAKCLPDLKSVEHKGTIGRKSETEMTLDEINDRLIEIARQRAALAERAATPAPGSSTPPELH